MKIAFHSNQLSLRGTEVAMYDYAHYNEEILGNDSIILTKKSNVLSHHLAISKFEERFKVFYYEKSEDIDKILLQNNVQVLYAIKAGMKDKVLSKKVKTVVHSVFQYNEPHGDVYAYVSEWLGRKYKKPFVPHMVTLPHSDKNLREELGIPSDAMVFGRHGGFDTFDIPYALDLVRYTAKHRKNVYFLFLNTKRFTHENLKNVIYLEGTQDLIKKVEFINTCDAMIHARRKGETFGLSIAEFSIKNKPIVTCKHGVETAHVDMLGDKGLYYTNEKELKHLLMNWTPNPKKDWNAYKEFSPEKVMQKFKKVFL